MEIERKEIWQFWPSVRMEKSVGRWLRYDGLGTVYNFLFCF